jgi:hypothetical protein
VGGIACQGQGDEVCLHHYGPSATDDGRSIIVRHPAAPSAPGLIEPDADGLLLIDWLPTEWGYAMVRVSDTIDGRPRVRCFFPDDIETVGELTLLAFCRNA